MAAPKVFVSYSSRDRAEALDLLGLLESHGCDVWLDFFDIQPTARLASQLAGGVDAVDVVCLLLSPTAVASRWVAVEIEHALERAKEGLRILPVILRPCRIPDLLDEIVGIDATDGLSSEPVRLRLVRAVVGGEKVEDAVLLDAATRQLLANREIRERADEELPAVVAEIDRIRDEPIRRLDVRVQEHSLPSDPPLVLELVFDVDPMHSAPMRFFFARYREGRTWPEDFGFDEPPYSEYFLRARQRVDMKFRWYDRLMEPRQSLDGTDLRDLPASFTLELDGSEFQPAGPGVHTRQRLEIPPLRVLAGSPKRFGLIAHDPETRTAAEVDLATTDIDIELTAYYAEAAPGWCTLFRSRPDPFERLVYGCRYLADVESEIERTALVAAYAPVRERRGQEREERARRVRTLVEQAADEALADDDRRSCARLVYGDALLAAQRANDAEAVNGYIRTANLLRPLVLERSPEYEDGAFLYLALWQIVVYFVRREDWENAREYLPNLGALSRRLTEADPAEADYRRMQADAASNAALIYAGLGDAATAAGALRERVSILRELAAALPVPARLEDVRRALAEGLMLAARRGLEELVPVEEWKAALDPERERADQVDAALAAEREPPLPVWFRPVELATWPTGVVQSGMLRYELRMRKGWSEHPKVSAVDYVVTHVYRGRSPAEWLIVSTMEHADDASDLAQWLEAALALTGFPVLEMQDVLDTPPQLLEWGRAGRPADVARTFGVDDARFFTGLAHLPGTVPRLARIYGLLARRGSFAWKIVLAFESACLPGTPQHLVDVNDHARAGATFGALRLL